MPSTYYIENQLEITLASHFVRDYVDFRVDIAKKAALEYFEKMEAICREIQTDTTKVSIKEKHEILGIASDIRSILYSFGHRIFNLVEVIEQPPLNNGQEQQQGNVEPVELPVETGKEKKGQSAVLDIQKMETIIVAESFLSPAPTVKKEEGSESKNENPLPFKENSHVKLNDISNSNSDSGKRKIDVKEMYNQSELKKARLSSSDADEQLKVDNKENFRETEANGSQNYSSIALFDVPLDDDDDDDLSATNLAKITPKLQPQESKSSTIAPGKSPPKGWKLNATFCPEGITAKVVPHKFLTPAESSLIAMRKRVMVEKFVKPKSFYESDYFDLDKFDSIMESRMDHFQENFPTILSNNPPSASTQLMDQSFIVDYFQTVANFHGINPEQKSIEEFLSERPLVKNMKSKPILDTYKMEGKFMKNAKFVSTFDEFPDCRLIAFLLIQFVIMAKCGTLKVGVTQACTRQKNGKVYLECSRFKKKIHRVEQLHNKNVMFIGPANVLSRLEVVVHKILNGLNLSFYPEKVDDNNPDYRYTSYDGICILYVACVPKVTIYEWVTHVLIQKSIVDTLLLFSTSTYHRKNYKFPNNVMVSCHGCSMIVSNKIRSHRNYHYNNSGCIMPLLTSGSVVEFNYDSKYVSAFELYYGYLIEYKEFHNIDLISSASELTKIFSETQTFMHLNAYVGITVDVLINSSNLAALKDEYIITDGIARVVNKENMAMFDQSPEINCRQKFIAYINKHNHMGFNIQECLKAELWAKT